MGIVFYIFVPLAVSAQGGNCCAWSLASRIASFGHLLSPEMCCFCGVPRIWGKLQSSDPIFSASFIDWPGGCWRSASPSCKSLVCHGRALRHLQLSRWPGFVCRTPADVSGARTEAGKLDCRLASLPPCQPLALGCLICNWTEPVTRGREPGACRWVHGR